MAQDPSELNRKMSEALDQTLSPEELEALHQQIEAAAGESERWSRMQRVDRLLRSTPLLAPSADFAGRVMAAIARLQLDELAERKISLGVALGLMAAALLAVPVLSAALILMVSVLSNPATVAALLEAAAAGTSYAIDLVLDLVRVLRNVATDTPMLPALLSTMIPLSMLWLWLLWYLSGRPRINARP
jgi:hypothetical protein